MDFELSTIRWDMRWLSLAELVSTWSLDPSTKVGCVIVDDKRRVISLSYNGLPRGMKDDERLADREWKYSTVAHAEANSLLFAKCDVSGYTIYTYPFSPCSRCGTLIVQAGIKRVVTFKNNIIRWAANMEIARETFKECGVELVEYGNEELEKII